MAFATIEEAMAAEADARAKFEQITIAFRYLERDYTMAEARATFDKYLPGINWKQEFEVTVEMADVPVFARAAQFYHGGDFPTIRASSLPGMFRVTGNGYVC